MQSQLIYIFSNLWLPILLWTFVAGAFLFYQQLVNKSSIDPLKGHRWITFIIWLLPTSVCFQFFVAKLISGFSVFKSIPTVAKFPTELTSFIVNSQAYGNDSSLMLLTALAIVWGVGFLFVGIKLVASWFMLQKQLKSLDTINWEDLQGIDLADVAFKQFGNLINNTPIKVSSDVISPCVVNAYKPVIVIPAELLSSVEVLRIALLHELCHIKYNDLSHSLANQIIKAFFWFHPLVYTYLKWASRNREQRCDIEVINNAAIDKAVYAASLVLVSKTYRPLSLVSMAADSSQLKMRIEALSRYNVDNFEWNQKKATHLIGFTSFLFLSALLLLNPKSEISLYSNSTTIVQSLVSPEIIGGMSAIVGKISYPNEARANGIEGRVVVQFIVDESGKALDIQIIRGIGYGCDEEAINAIKSTLFKPTLVNGMNALTRYSIPIVFKLQNGQ